MHGVRLTIVLDHSRMRSLSFCIFFFFNDTATTEIYTLSLHDALPISIWSAAGALVAKIGLNLLLIPRLGLNGAAVATSLVYVTLLTVKIIAFTMRTGTSVATLVRPAWEDVRDNLATARRWVGIPA